jgi:hypothetical protein
VARIPNDEVHRLASCVDAALDDVLIVHLVRRNVEDHHLMRDDVAVQASRDHLLAVRARPLREEIVDNILVDAVLITVGIRAITVGSIVITDRGGADGNAAAVAPAVGDGAVDALLAVVALLVHGMAWAALSADVAAEELPLSKVDQHKGLALHAKEGLVCEVIFQVGADAAIKAVRPVSEAEPILGPGPSVVARAVL